MGVVTEKTVRVVARVDLQAIIDELVESDPAVLVKLVETAVMEMGDEVRRALIDALNKLYWQEKEDADEEDDDVDID